MTDNYSKKKRVLVFPCGSEIGLEIHRSLSSSTHFELIGGSSVSDHGEYVYQQYIGGLPSVDERQFIDKINELIVTEEIDFIFPAHDSAVLRLAEASHKGALKAILITSPLQTCQIARSKQLTYKSLSGIVAVPSVYDHDTRWDDIEYPVFLKPDVGQGSKGTYRADTPADIAYYKSKDDTLLTLEYLPGKEYTVDCFTNQRGELLFSKGRSRQRVSGGISVSSVHIEDPRFAELSQKINRALKFRGVWFFQVKERANGELVLLEIATRVAGTMGLTRCIGVNLPLLSLFDFMDIEVSLFENSAAVRIDRALQNSYRHSITYEHVYIDFDDLIMVDDKVNTQAIAFVYQCLNSGIGVYLITKHAGDLQARLKQLRLENLFDEVILVEQNSDKYKYITRSNSIFIDDSYTERLAVHEKLKIPVFDGHMLESLISK